MGAPLIPTPCTIVGKFILSEQEGGSIVHVNVVSITRYSSTLYIGITLGNSVLTFIFKSF